MKKKKKKKKKLFLQMLICTREKKNYPVSKEPLLKKNTQFGFSIVNMGIKTTSTHLTYKRECYLTKSHIYKYVEEKKRILTVKLPARFVK